MSNNQSIIIGCGTGRSGTHSLSALFNKQLNTIVYHELEPKEMQWEGAEEFIKKIIGYFQKSLANNTPLNALKQLSRGNIVYSYRELKFIGDIGFYYLPYTDLIMTLDPRIKMICIERDQQSTVQSYLRKTRTVRKKKIGEILTVSKIIDRNHWIEHNGKKWKLDELWDKCYPKYDVKTKVEALNKYWEDYHALSSKFQLKYPNRFKVFPINNLNSIKGQKSILTYLDFPVNLQELNVGVQTNQSRREH